MNPQGVRFACQGKAVEQNSFLRSFRIAPWGQRPTPKNSRQRYWILGCCKGSARYRQRWKCSRDNLSCHVSRQIGGAICCPGAHRLAHVRFAFTGREEARGSSAEVDYLAVKNGTIYPIEVKSGPSGALRSLHLFLNKYPNCPQGIVLYGGTYNNLPDQNLIFLPLYCAATVGDRRPAIL